jgi:uncharacterized protein (DUF1778 family)
MADRGRPKKDDAERRSKLLQMRVTEAELHLIKRAAASAIKSPPTWVRDTVLEQASVALNDRPPKKASKRGA